MLSLPFTGKPFKGEAVEAMEPREWFTLLKLAELGALKHPIFVTTTRLSSELGCSQQTVSRWLRGLSKGGYIERKVELRGEYVKITRKGLEGLLKVQSRLTFALKPPKGRFLTLEGEVFTGFGEGAYYITKDEGFHNGTRTYGSLKCLPAIIDGKVEGHVLFIQRTHYNASVLELISPLNLREALKLKDGSKVKVKVPLPEAGKS